MHINVCYYKFEVKHPNLSNQNWLTSLNNLTLTEIGISRLNLVESNLILINKFKFFMM